ncbi:MAG: hypothetical protein JF596_17120 [Stenotrophomonas sp.]|nr:hypothetical protein [Stenotrophomonas sp.]
MATNDPNTRKRASDPELDALNAKYGEVRSGYEAAAGRARNLSAARDQLGQNVKTELIVPRNEFQAPYEISNVPGGSRAIRTLDGQIAQANTAKEAFAKPLQDAAQGFRDYTARTQQNTLLRSVGVAPPARTLPGGAPVSAQNAASLPNSPGTPTPAAAAAQLTPGSPNSFTGANGVTRSVAAAPAAAGARAAPRSLPPVVAANTTAPMVQDSTQRATDAIRGAALQSRADAADVVTDGLGPSAELMRRLDIAQSSYQNRGSPSSRAAVAQAILGQLAARNQASAAGQGATNAVLQGGAASENAANEAFAGRKQQARMFDAEGALQQDQSATEGRRVNRTLTGSDGTTSVLSNDGTLTPITGQNGQAFRELRTDATGRITPEVQLKYLGEQRKAILENVALPDEQRTQQLAAIDERVAGLLPQPAAAAAAAPAIPQPAIDFLKKNPNRAAEFDAKYGAGASTRYLSR